MALKVKSVDGQPVETEAVLEQQEAPKVEKPTTSRNDAGDIVVSSINLPKPETDAVQKPEAEKVPLQEQADSSKEAIEAPAEEEEVRAASLGEVHNPEKDETSKPTLERVEDGDESPAPTSKQEEVPAAPQASQLPEDVEKLVAFLDETGGTVEDYVNLNRDISKLDDVDVLKEYYRQKNPRLSESRLERKMDKDFLFDEDLDDEGAIQDKKDLFEDELYEAQKYLDGRKDKYYADLKSNAAKSLPPEAQEALSFYNDQKLTAETQKQLNDTFLDRTEKLFSQDFKGFDFKVGDEKFRVNVGDAKKVQQDQSDFNNFVTKFVGEDGSITDPAGFHKAMYAANNVDALATHFYEQGRADAITQSAKSSKNIDMGGRTDMSSSPSKQQGSKIRVLDSPSDGRLRFKQRK